MPMRCFGLPLTGDPRVVVSARTLRPRGAQKRIAVVMEHERGRRRTPRPETAPPREDAPVALPFAAGNQAVVRMLARLKRGAADAARFQYQSAQVMKAVGGGNVNLERPTKASGPILPTGVPARGATA